MVEITPQARKIILIVVIIVAAGGVIATGVAVTRSILSKASESEPTPPTTVVKLAPPGAPAKTSTPSAAPTTLTNRPAPAATPAATPASTTTSTGWTVTGTGNVDITPTFSFDLKNLYVDFAGADLNLVTGMDYSLSYTADPNIPRLVKGSFSAPFTRKAIPLGTCSGTACVYDTNPAGFVLRVLVKTNNGLTVNLKTLTFAGAPTAGVQ
ncbi:hypothetical protein M1403_02865 [Patescibacteria group bacterium]|nr:hypothetical protein [Patescibacteria group bacterium]